MKRKSNELLPKISIIIPCLNKVRFIELTLLSILNQNYKNLEIIIMDGKSTDGSLEIIKKYAKSYPKIITWISKKDGGQLEAVNRGLAMANGDILGFINADDVYCSEIFAELSKYYLNNPAALWFAGKGLVIDENNNEIAKTVTLYKNLLFALNNYGILLTINYLIQPSVFLTRRAYVEYGPFTGTTDFLMEYDLWLKIGKKSMPKIINKTFSKFRIERSTKTKRLFKEILNEDQKIAQKYTGNPLILKLHKLNNFGRILVGRFY